MIKSLFLSGNCPESRVRGRISISVYLRTFILGLMFLLTVGSVSISWAVTYHGTVVDAETGEPLKGAVIAIIWYKKAFVSMEGDWSFHNAKETVTDAEGKFLLDGSAGINWNPFTLVQDPEVIIYHPGYGPLSPSTPREFNDLYGIYGALKAGAIIKLPKLKTREERVKFVDVPGLGAPYHSIPNLMRVVNEQRKNVGLKPFIDPDEKGKVQ